MDLTNWSPIAKTYSALMAGSIDGTDSEPHDKAVIRAVSAKYKPGKEVVGDPENTVFVTRLSTSVDEEVLLGAFSEFGDIKRIRLVRDIVTGHSRCYGFIEYSDGKSAYRAQRDGNRMILHDKEIFVDFECERVLKGWVPRRLGGGFGGKKESGQLRFGGKDRPFRKPLIVDHVSRPPGENFRERLDASESGRWNSGRDREHTGDRYRHNRHRDADRYESDRSGCRRDHNRDDKYQYSERDKYRRDDREDRERDRSRDRSRSDRYRCRGRERSQSSERTNSKRDRDRQRQYDNDSKQLPGDSDNISSKLAEDLLKQVASETKTFDSGGS